MGIAEEAIFNDIEHCALCGDHKPFHFEMGWQRGMLISFAPSQAALHRPLYFVQLFRKLCLALFGDAPPSEDFIREFNDPAGNIYWTHYQKCFKRGEERGRPHCEPLLKREVELLDPELVIILGRETIRSLSGHSGGDLRSIAERHPYIAARRDGAPRLVFLTDFPARETARNFEEIRGALKRCIPWVQVDCGDLDFSGANFMDLEYASIAFLDECAGAAAVAVNEFERAWMNGIILPNIRAYNLVLQTFIFIESNIKNLLESRLPPHEDIEKRWFTPFENLLCREIHGSGPEAEAQRQAVRGLMRDIDSLHALRNAIAHKSGVVDDRDEEKNLRYAAKLKRLEGVYIYGGNSIFVSDEGVEYILGICNRFREIYRKYFMG